MGVIILHDIYRAIMKILIIYGTTEGQTRKIARYMEENLQAKGHAVSISDASDDPPSPQGFDAVILGGSLHMMKHQAALADYATRHAAMLNNMPGVFFSVSLGIVTGEENALAEARRIADEFVHNAGWSPQHIELIAGALKYTQYDFFKRFMMKMISTRSGGSADTSQDHEYTDWEQVAALCDRVIAMPRFTAGNA